MNTLRRAHAWIITRTGGVEQSERGSGPLSDGIIQAGLAALAVIVVGVIVAKTTGFLGKIESLVP